MPKETFHNLLPTKQEQILRAAAEEFARQPYETASLTQIVAVLGIAKGSMYQYFANKQELYRYVVEQAYAAKKAYLDPVWQQKLPFFEQVVAYYKATYLFSREQPLLHQVIHQFWESRDTAVQEDIQSGLAQREADFHRMLTEAQATGSIAGDIEKEAAFFVYHSVGKQLIDDFQQVRHEDWHEHLRFIEQVLRVLQMGLKAR